MATDFFIKIDGVTGESVDSKHKDEIDVLAWSWGGSNAGSMHVAQGGGSGKANFQDISLTKYIDKASSTLWQYMSKGTHVDSAKLTVRKAGGDDPVEYFVIELKHVLVSSISTGGGAGEERLTENISLNFGEFKVVYTPQDAKGAAGAAVEFGYNIAEGKTV